MCIQTNKTINCGDLIDGNDYFLEVGTSGSITLTFNSGTESFNGFVIDPEPATGGAPQVDSNTITFDHTVAGNRYDVHVYWGSTQPPSAVAQPGESVSAVSIDDFPVKKPVFKPVVTCPS